MVIMKDELECVDVNVLDEELKNLLTEWCMGDYRLFGSVFKEVENIGNRIVLIDYHDKDNSFVTFDKHANPVIVNLVVDDRVADTRKMIIDKYDYVREFLYNNFYPYINIEMIKENNYSSKKMLKKSKYLYDDNVK